MKKRPKKKKPKKKKGTINWVDFLNTLDAVYWSYTIVFEKQIEISFIDRY